MNEGRTTAIFAAVAVVTFGLAWWSRPEAITDESDLKRERTGQSVFVKFEDPAEAASFQIVKYDEELGQLERFEVAKDKTSNMWKLPSFDDYPADAAEQVRDATTPLISLPILDVTSLDRGDHSLYGVVNPDEEGLTVGESGVGMLLRVKDNADQVLADLIVGKEVAGAENQRYVRIPSEDAVYVVEINTASFTTDFQKWINQELLEIRNFDIADVGLRDYAILPTQTGYGMSRNFDADLSYDSAGNKWSLDKLVTYESGKAVEDSLGEDKQLNETALNDLRNAVQDLKIVSVRRKPNGLAADLKADKSLMENEESLKSLVSQGFIPQDGADGTEIFATGGETLVGTAAGVKYLLRFGEAVANLSGAAGEAEETGLRRYLLVSATLDESKFPAPDLEPLPETVEDMLARQKALDAANQPAQPAPPEPAADVLEVAPGNDPANEPAGDQPAGETGEDTPPASDQPAPDNPAAEAAVDASADAPSSPPAEPPTSDDGDASASEPSSDSEPSNPTLELDDCGPQEETAEAASQPPAEDDAADAEAAPDAEPAAGEVAEPLDAAPPAPAPADTPADDAAPAAEKPADAQPAADAPPAADAQPAKTQEELEEELQFVREQVAKENQRKIDERNEKLDAARKRVRELNARFADWYYVVSDSVYKKLKVSRDQLIVEKGATPPAGDLQPGNLPPANLPPGGFQFGP